MARQQDSPDDLTGLSNRRGFRTIAAHLLSVCKRSASPAVIVLMDLDRFKQINDTQGHPEGDRVLKDFAATLLRTFRGSDQTDITLTLQRFQEGLDARQAPGTPPILSSAGLTHYDPRKHADADALLSAVDAQMYERKRKTKLQSQAGQITG